MSPRNKTLRPRFLKFSFLSKTHLRFQPAFLATSLQTLGMQEKWCAKRKAQGSREGQGPRRAGGGGDRAGAERERAEGGLGGVLLWWGATNRGKERKPQVPAWYAQAWAQLHVPLGGARTR